MRYFLITVFLLAMGCGSGEECAKDQYNQETSCSDGNTFLNAVEGEEAFLIEGSVVGAFEVEVDGIAYADIEDFYAQESARLPEKIESLGYEGYEVTFEAEIGYTDLTRGMTVFLAPEENRGYAAKTHVKSDDTFQFKLPNEAAGDVYRVKAVKRISVLISSESEQRRFCYNFAAVERDISYEDIDKPIVLTSFETRITDYKCEMADRLNDGLVIPAY